MIDEQYLAAFFKRKERTLSRECKYNCRTEGPPGPIWCRQCGHDPKCCNCEDYEGFEDKEGHHAEDHANDTAQIGQAGLIAVEDPDLGKLFLNCEEADFGLWTDNR